jgi:prophage antirepressor-like protein
MKQLDIFNFKNKDVRTALHEDNSVWFCLKDVCESLDIKNTAVSNFNFVKKGIESIDTLTEGGTQKLTYIAEQNLYRMIFKSTKEKAQEFQSWVFDEVLPTIQKTGSYSVTNTEPQLALPSPRSQAINVIKECLELTALFNIPEHISQLEAVKQAQDETGFDATPMLRLAPAQQRVAKEEIMLEPTPLSKHFGLSAKTMNLYLEELGLQHKVLDNWHPINEGVGMAAINHWKSSYGSKDGYNYRWNLTMLKEFIANR